MAVGTDIGIGVGSAFAVIAAIGIAFALYQPSVREFLGRMFGSFFFSVTNFIPFAFITFGLIADVIGQEFRYSMVSITGFLAIILNAALRYILEPMFGITGQMGGAEEGWCFIPGLEPLESRATPMNIVSTSAIILYLLIFAVVDRQPGQNISLIISLPIMFCLQLATFYFGGCDPYYPSGLSGKLVAILIGSIVGASMYGIVANAFPQLAPFANVKNMSPPTSSSGYQGAKPPTVGGPPTGGKCSAANTDDDNAYVCEAYKNGQLVTETISG